MPPRPDGRENNEIRKITLTRGYLPYPEGSCLIEMGMTKVIATASVDETLPQWLRDSPTGWVTAEYGMLPPLNSYKKPQDVSRTSSKRTYNGDTTVDRTIA